MNSAGVRYTEPLLIENAVEMLVRRLVERHEEITDVYWFGSWTRGTFGPRSDVDLCIVVSQDDEPRRARAVRYIPKRFPVDLDLVVYTLEEFQTLADTHPEWYGTISRGRHVFSRS